MSVTDGGIYYHEATENGKPKLNGINDPRQVYKISPKVKFKSNSGRHRPIFAMPNMCR